MLSHIHPAVAVTALLFLASLGVTALLWARLRRLRREQAAERDRAVARAREDFTRDMHDLVGHWLWLASIKSELAYRQAHGDARLRGDLAEALQAVRHAAHAVRNASRSHRNLSLHGEAVRAEALLWSLGADCLIQVDATGLPADLNMALGAVVRESVTNMLRHSAVRKCVIETTRHDGRLRLTVANDGAAGPGRFPAGRSRSASPSGTLAAEPAPGSTLTPGPRPDPHPQAGGLANLRQRMARLGGTVDAAAGPDGWFRLVAEAPVDFSE
ncbi:integral membrane sensor signal transduction histidine kinase [Planomonospora sphaerica]|uniref:Integral membrane sensor signal transduction histidine kinase n=1 Tax=Planomonospora sphaerica TaxID=161355 RepID=A0A161LJM6_9ACTN|nr:histidine kinase [Planomonospora sphaerica]GAT65897.1 integral membrane sensor signal transduction histidine kinase [Planomonospora sphaerica]